MPRLLILQLLFIATVCYLTAATTCPQLSRITNAELSALRSSYDGLLVRLECKYDNIVTAANNYVNISFPQPVAIHGIITRGFQYETLGENYHSYIRRSTFSYYNGTSLVTLPVSISMHVRTSTLCATSCRKPS